MSQFAPSLADPADWFREGTTSTDGLSIIVKEFTGGTVTHSWKQIASVGGGGVSPLDAGQDAAIAALAPINALTSTSTTAPLSANQGTVLNAADIASGDVVGSNIVIALKGGGTVTINATALLADIRVTSGGYVAATKTIDLTMTSGPIVSIPVAALLPVARDSTLSGDGATTALRVELSTDAGNILVYGADGKIKALGVTLDGNDRHVVRTTATTNAAPTAAEVPTPINGDTAKVFLSDRSIEYWSYDAGAWARNYISNTSPDPVVDVTGATLPITFPVAAIPGTPVFAPATPTDSAAIYAITNGAAIQYAKWNGTQYISAPAPAAAPGHFRSGNGATGPDGVSDSIENVSRTGNTGLGIVDPSTLLFKLELDGTTGVRQATFANTGAVCTIPGTATTSKSAIVVTQTVSDAVLLFADANLAIKAGQEFTVINSDLSTNKISYLGYDIHPNQSLRFVHTGRMWQIEEVGINSDVQLETAVTVLPTSLTALNSFGVVPGGIQSSTTTWVEVPGTSFVATTGGEYLVKYVAYASCTGVLNIPVVGNGFRIAVGSNIVTGSVQVAAPATGRVVPTSESLITNLAAGQIDPYTKSVIVRAKPGETIQLQMNSVVGAQIVYQSAAQNSRLEYAKIVSTSAAGSIDEIVNVAGATLPLAFPLATLPGAPGFSPATPTSLDAIYKFANGQLAVWDGTSYQSFGSPIRSNWSSNTTAANTPGLPDGLNDLTEKVRRDGLVGINVDAASTLDVAGSIGYGITPLTASATPYTFLIADTILDYTGGFAGVGQLTFPSAATFPRRIIGIRMPATDTFSINLISGGGNIELLNNVLSGSARINSAALGYIEWQSDGTIWRLVNYDERKFYSTVGYAPPSSGFTTFVDSGGVAPAPGVAFQIPANATSWLVVDGNYVGFVALPIAKTISGRFSVYVFNSAGFDTTISTQNTDLPRDTSLSSGQGRSMHFEWSNGLWRWIRSPELLSSAMRYQRRGTYAAPLPGAVTVGAEDDLLVVAPGATVTLGSSAGVNQDRRINIKKPGVGSITLTGNIDGVANSTLVAANESLTLHADGATWIRI
jgi:hypothetical protein